MEEKLYLHIPEWEELWYRQRLMQDPDTMRYNRGYTLDIEGYDSETGCIAFPESAWRDWYQYFIGQEPRRFYAYVVRALDGMFIGEVNVHKSGADPWYEMGVVIEARHRGHGYGGKALELLLEYAFGVLKAEAVHNSFEEEREAAVRAHLSAGFTEYRRENGVLELVLTREQYERGKAIEKMADKIEDILRDRAPSIYLHGSSVLEDFRPGWSDIDILVLTQSPISEQQAQKLVVLRQTLLGEEEGNCYYRSFEGGMLSLQAFLDKKPDRVVYWGTSGQRITDRFAFDSMCRMELLEKGVLLRGEEIRNRLTTPAYGQLYGDIKAYYELIRNHVQKTDGSFYSFGWLLDIARGIYTLRTGTVISKTRAGEWALREGICPVPQELEKALCVRREPLRFKEDETCQELARSLGPAVQRFADILEQELAAKRAKFCGFSQK